MNSTLSNHIIKAKNGNNESLLFLISKFDPLLIKYSKLSICEDCKSELSLCFIETIYKIPMALLHLKNDQAILIYIKKSIINKYINIGKYTNKSNSHEYVCQIQDWNNKLEFHSDIFFLIY